MSALGLGQTLAGREQLGSQKVRAQSTRNGAPRQQPGVKLGDIRKVAQNLKTDHERALERWKSGHVETWLLATLVCKPGSLSAKELDGWVQSTTWSQEADWLDACALASHPGRGRCARGG